MSEKNLSEHATQFAIGKLIPEDVEMGRDAIHIAVMQVTAGHTLTPGDDIGLDERGFAREKKSGITCVGIVDPFLKQNVKTNDKFFLFLYPNTITSLKHLWSHPELPTKEQSDFAALMTHGTTKSQSVIWLEKYAADHDIGYRKLMTGADNWIRHGENTHLSTDIEYDKTEDFWKHYEIVTGKVVEDGKKDTIFTCSC